MNGRAYAIEEPVGLYKNLGLVAGRRGTAVAGRRCHVGLAPIFPTPSYPQ